MTLRTPLRPKRCRVCREQYTPTKPLQKVCSPPCALSLAVSIRGKAEKRELVKAKERIKTRSQWQKEAQAAFNAWVRERDAKLPCISCGRLHEGQWHAGHFLSTGARPNLRFEPANVWRQCSPCNVHLSGNLINYRRSLVERIGLAAVEALEADHTPRHYSVEELRQIRDKYRKLAREIARAVK